MLARRVASLGLVGLLGVAGGCTTTSASPDNQRAYELGVGHVPGLGAVLVDSTGKTLYLYVPDHQGASRCKGYCAVTWPPLLTQSGRRVRFGPGVDAALVGTVRRADGALQVTYDRWPLYAWHLDTTQGEATGEGDDMGLWYVISPRGVAIH